MKPFDQLPEMFQHEMIRAYYHQLNKKKISLYGKIVFDCVMALLLIVLLSPVLIGLGIWIKLDSKGPAIYRQIRVTQYGRKFEIWKFRTMVVDADKQGSLVTQRDDNRITRVGQMIRRYRLDELPQLVNVLRGDMSFVGTRPEVPKYIKGYTDEMNATLLLPAGITSPASIHYKDEDKLIAMYLEQGLTVDEAYITHVLPAKMTYNLEYIREFSFLNDVKIMLDTVIKVLK